MLRLRLAAEQGNADAQYSLGVMYDDGRGVPQDGAEAVKWYRLAAEQGYSLAQFNLGVMYAHGSRGVPQDGAEAVKWYRLAAEQGRASAQHNLGLMYQDGRGVPQDGAEAVKWYRLAAEQGHASAQFLVGEMDNRRGVGAPLTTPKPDETPVPPLADRPPKEPMPEDFGVTEQAIRDFNRIQFSDDPLEKGLFYPLWLVLGGVVLYRTVVTWPSFSGAKIVGFLIPAFGVQIFIWFFAIVISGWLCEPIRTVFPRKPPPPHPQRDVIVAYLEACKQYEIARDRFEKEKRERAAWERRQRETKKLQDSANLREMDPIKFEQLLAQAYRNLGWTVRETRATGDRGVDAYLERDGRKHILQCKRYSSSPVGAPFVRELIGTIVTEHADGAILVTTSSFSKGAEEVAATQDNVQLIDHSGLRELLKKAFPDSSPIPAHILDS